MMRRSIGVLVAAGWLGCQPSPESVHEDTAAQPGAPAVDPPGTGAPADPTEPGDGTQTGTPDPWDADADHDGWTVGDGDCDDHEAAVRPDADEVCDGLDNDCSGFVDDGLPEVLAQETDYGADGVADAVTFTTYDTSGRSVLREVDTDGDGVIDTIESYAYVTAPTGELLEMQTDIGDDGTVDAKKIYLYDANGVLLGTETRDAYGALTRVDTYFYDDAGQRIAWELDADGDGDVDTRYDYTYDPVTGMLIGLLLQRYDETGAVTSASIYAYEYTAFGRTWRTHIDLTADGVLDNTTEYFYDANENLIRSDLDTGRDGTIDSSTSYKYDNWGELEVIEIDSLADGNPETRVTRWQTC